MSRGSTDMRELGRKGGNATKERHGREHFGKAGKKGGAAKAAKYDHDYYVEVGRKGGQRMRELVAKGRALVAAEEGEDA